MRVSIVFFLLCGLTALMWVQASAGAVDKTAMQTVEDHREAFERGSESKPSITAEDSIKNKLNSVSKKHEYQATTQQQQQTGQQDKASRVENCASSSSSDSCSFVGSSSAESEGSSKKNSDADHSKKTVSNEMPPPKTIEEESSFSGIGNVYERDSLTTLISTFAVCIAIYLWIYGRNSSNTSSAGRRRLNRASNNNGMGKSRLSSKELVDSWSRGRLNEEDEEDDDEDNEDVSDDEVSPLHRSDSDVSSLVDGDTASSVSAFTKPTATAAIASSDIGCVLVTADDVTVGPCRAMSATRRSFVARGGIVRTVAVIIRTQSGNQVLLRRDPKTGTLSLAAHGPVKFCIEELEAEVGSLNAASRIAREQLSRVLFTSASASASCLDSSSKALTFLDSAFSPSSFRMVGRAQWLAPSNRSHELVHIVTVEISEETEQSLLQLQKERETDVLLQSSGRDSLVFVSQSDFASGVLSLHPLLQALMEGKDGFLFGSAGASFSSIKRLVKTALPSVPTMCVTRVGGPKSSIPFATKLHQLSCMVAFKMSMKKRKFDDADEELCFDLLQKVSRSFAMVIEGLCDELRTPICIFYLVLRALDTVEDDIHISREEKELHLKAFHLYLESPEAVPEQIRKYGDGGYLELMENFSRVVRVHCRLKAKYQETIVVTTRRMAEGMLLFLDSQNNVQLHSEYNEYCFYVAGLVGLGLSDMFVSSGLEPDLAPGPMCGPHIEAPVKPTVAAAYSGSSGPRASACAMALILQKTNILRDYKEDIDDGRLWWPREVWACYASAPADFQTENGLASGLACLNHLIVDAMRHLPGCLDFLERIRDKTVFSFCAVPQAMAIATLVTCFNNPNVFHRNVKISKGEACAAILACRDVNSFARWSKEYVQELRLKTDVDPVLFANARSALAAAEASLERLV